MKPGDQRLLHLLNVAACIVATLVARAGWDASTAKHVALGSLTMAASVAAIGWLVGVATAPEGSGAGKGGAVFALVTQLFVIGGLIWWLEPEGMPFGAGCIAVLGATVLGSLIDGWRQSKLEDAESDTSSDVKRTDE